MLPFSKALKTPVVFYGPVKIGSLKGKLEIKSPLKRGMIGFGQRFEKMTKHKGVAEIVIDGHLVFNSNAHIGKDYFFYVGKDAYCEFGFMGCLGSDVKLICTHKIILGDWCGIGYESQLIDTNSHPMFNTKTKEVYPIYGVIKLGSYNAISNRVTIMLNTKTPDNCVIASNSLCNADYLSLGENILLGGIPAQLIKNNFNRDWESEKEVLIRNKILAF